MRKTGGWPWRPGPRLVALPGIDEALAAVARGDMDEAVVPLENSTEGAVNQTQDLLAHVFSTLQIKGEVILPVVHHLLAPPGVELARVERVLSHPQALAQCREFIRRHLPRAQVVETASTAAAVRLVASAGAPWAAVGPEAAAREYGLTVLVEKINDFPGNATRFIVVGREESACGISRNEPMAKNITTAPVKEDTSGEGRCMPVRGGGKASGCNGNGFKTSLIVSTAHRPGALHEVLAEFARRGINLTRIESRPSRRRLGEYLFFIDLEGHRLEQPVRGALEAVAGRAELRILGSYPVDDSPVAESPLRKGGIDPCSGTATGACSRARVVPAEPVDGDESLPAVRRKQMETVRAAIDQVDARIVDLLARRQKLVARVGQLKAGMYPVRDHRRESRVLARVKGLALEKGLDPARIEQIYRLIIQYAVCIQSERQGEAARGADPDGAARDVSGGT
ncbi:MAG: prephenate dehydratase [Thermoanaerobacteraceae bacterium]|nr:prephenate dehydratase [Thermoanaerobacteraceae bacterium]